MKILMIAIAGMSMSCLNFSYSQSKDFLRNYQAPDFKYRTLSLLFDGSSSGLNNSTNNYHSANFGGTVNYFHRTNSSLYQGTLFTSNTLSGIGTNNSTNLVWSIRNTHQLNTQNRFFVNRGAFFLGAHANVRGQHLHSHNLTDSAVANSMNFILSPQLSFGWGRLEPVSFARQAMDIDFILKQDGISDGMNESELKSLSDKIALASNRRFFDQRHKRIYELETIDSTIADLGFLPKRNMRYFSRFQDAYFFALQNERLSGMRHELGFNLQGVFDVYNNNEFEPIGGLWFYQFSYYLPQSWSLQHNLNSRIEGNAHTLRWSSFYTFGIYPTTRTAIRLSAQFGSQYDFTTDTFGSMIGGSGRITYYISPRFRLNGSFRVTHAKDYLWNPILSSSFTNQTSYGFDIGLSYAIF